MIKKVIVFAICFMIIISALNLSYAADYRSSIDLSKIISIFNNCAKVKEYQERNITVKATDEGSVLKVTITQNEETKTLECEIDGNYLGVVDTDNIDTETVSEIWNIIVDCAKEVPGYKVSNSETSHTMRISDMNDYIKVEDLRDMEKDIIDGNKAGTVYAGDVYACGYKIENDSKNVILLTQDGDISEKSYKSLMSIVQVMFNSEEAVEYFKQNYSSISEGNKEFEGVKIEINPKNMTQKETEIMSEIMGTSEEYNFVRVTIDKVKVNAKINSNSSNDTSNESDKNNDNKNTINNSNNTINNNQNTNTVNTQYKGNLPKTGEEIITLLMIGGIVVLLVIITVGARKYKDIK